MGDRVAVMNEGVLQQCATPRELFKHPVNAFVAGFIGSPAMNLLDGVVGDLGATYATLTVPMTADQRAAAGTGAVTIGVRPNDLAVATTGGLDAIVDVVEELGTEAFLYCTVSGAEQHVVARVDGLSGIRRGDLVSLIPSPGTPHLFDPVSGLRLPD